MTKDRRHQLIEQIKQFIKNTQRHKIIKIKETAALIGRLNFLRTQFREASLYLMLIDSAKTRAIKTQGWTGMMVSPLEALKELYWWIKKIAENKKQQIQDPIPHATIVTDASPQREMESEGIPDRKNKTSILSSEKTQTTDHNNTYPGQSEHNNRFTLETMQFGRLIIEERNNIGDMQDLEPHATDIYIRNSTQQIDQQLRDSGFKRTTYQISQHIQLQVDERMILSSSTNINHEQRNVENKIRQSTGNINNANLAGSVKVYKAKDSIYIKFLSLGSAQMILDIGQRMKDKGLKLPSINVAAFILKLNQTQEEIYSQDLWRLGDFQKME
ncbi:MAG: hypothetical protein EZS28_023407 [Streblomastix strix]|uniref:Uncharacterized protein n=1 Tax=Streblomastix strix TaxID=222440 RepID=A0A5J4VF22_9EUKA|nr:MAG: hypothetical protein EZS28_023407 [Streblomastix strix]